MDGGAWRGAAGRQKKPGLDGKDFTDPCGCGEGLLGRLDGGSGDDIIAHCRRELAHFKCPKSVEIGPLPKTSTGTVSAMRGRRSVPTALERRTGSLITTPACARSPE